MYKYVIGFGKRRLDTWEVLSDFWGKLSQVFGATPLPLWVFCNLPILELQISESDRLFKTLLTPQIILHMPLFFIWTWDMTSGQSSSQICASELLRTFESLFPDLWIDEFIWDPIYIPCLSHNQWLWSQSNFVLHLSSHSSLLFLFEVLFLWRTWISVMCPSGSNGPDHFTLCDFVNITLCMTQFFWCSFLRNLGSISTSLSMMGSLDSLRDFITLFSYRCLDSDLMVQIYPFIADLTPIFDPPPWDLDFFQNWKKL